MCSRLMDFTRKRGCGEEILPNIGCSHDNKFVWCCTCSAELCQLCWDREHFESTHHVISIKKRDVLEVQKLMEKENPTAKAQIYNTVLAVFPTAKTQNRIVIQEHCANYRKLSDLLNQTKDIVFEKLKNHDELLAMHTLWSNFAVYLTNPETHFDRKKEIKLLKSIDALMDQVSQAISQIDRDT